MRLRDMVRLLLFTPVASAALAGCEDPVSPEDKDLLERLEWSRQVGDSAVLVPVPVQPYADEEIVIYFGAGGRTVALAAKTGEPLWERDLVTSEDPLEAIFRIPSSWTRAVGAGSLVVVPGRELMALTRQAGETAWTWSPPGDSLATDALAAAGGRVFAGTAGGRLFALDATTGQPIWQVDLEERPFGITPSGGILYLGTRMYFSPESRESPFGRVRALALDPATGAVRWAFPIADPPSTGGCTRATCLAAALSMAPGALAGDVFVLSGRNGRFYGLDAAAGSLLWTSELEGGLEAGATVFGSLVVLTGIFQTTTAIEAQSGEVRWKLAAVPSLGSRYPAATGAGLVFTSETSLLAADPAGGVQWEFPAGISTAPVYSDGLVYGASLGILYAIRAEP